MTVPAAQHECDYVRLRAQLVDALTEADKGDALVAVHIETALAILDERVFPQSSDR